MEQKYMYVLDREKKVEVRKRSITNKNVILNNLNILTKTQSILLRT